MLFAVERRTVEGCAVLRVRGELDIATAEELAAAVDAALPASPDRLVLDLTEAEFIDSSGCRELALSARRARGAGVDAVVVCPPANTAVRTVLDLVAISALVPVLDEAP